MKVDVYYSGKRSGTKFLIVPAGTDLSSMVFPKDDPELDHRDLNMIRAKPFEREVSSDLYGVTPADVPNQIRAKGYAVSSSVIEPSLKRH